MRTPTVYKLENTSRYPDQMITEKRGDLTHKFDAHLSDGYKQHEFVHTYFVPSVIYDGKILLPFRVPGATRGHVTMEPMPGTDTTSRYKITDVVFYGDLAFGSRLGCYNLTAHELGTVGADGSILGDIIEFEVVRNEQ